MTATETWREDAACLGHAPLWDATVDDGGRYTGETPMARANRHELAKAICRRCPVARQCGLSARVGYDEGVRGAVVLPPLSEVTRAGSGRGGKCGTAWGEKRHRNQGEKPCDACSEARRIYDRKYNEKRRTA